jgi:hypothetical protein
MRRASVGGVIQRLRSDILHFAFCALHFFC